MIRVLSVASEAYPLVQTGGLGDVVGALPAALAPHDVAVTTLLPGYPVVMAQVRNAKTVHRYSALLGVEAQILDVTIKGRDMLVLNAPALFAREGGIYADKTGKDWSDNWRRFAALARAAADLASAPEQRFDILHAHDWQAAMAPAYLRFAPGPGRCAKSVVTIHNIAFQGQFDRGIFDSLGLPPWANWINGVEYYGGVGFLKAGLAAADAITTVSPSYASEIHMPIFGMGLEGLIRRGPISFRGSSMASIRPCGIRKKTPIWKSRITREPCHAAAITNAQSKRYSASRPAMVPCLWSPAV